MSTPTDPRASVLRDWARGDRALEAAEDLLIDAVGDKLLDGPWIRHDECGRWYFHTKHTQAEGGHLSGGERRVLAVAASLAVSNRPVDLGDAITGIDPDALQCVLRRRWPTPAALGLSRNLDRPTMSPIEDRSETRDGPDAAEPLERPRSHSEAPPRRLSEDHDETSISPLSNGAGASLARDLNPPREGPDRAPSEASKGPLLPPAGRSPDRDRVETVAFSWRAALTFRAALPAARTCLARLRQLSPSGSRPASRQAARAAAPGGPRTISRNEKLSYGAMTFHVSGCQRLRQRGAGARLSESIPRHGMSRFVDGRGRGAGGVPGLRWSAAERSRQGTIGVRSRHSNESEESP